MLIQTILANENREKDQLFASDPPIPMPVAEQVRPERVVEVAITNKRPEPHKMKFKTPRPFQS